MRFFSLITIVALALTGACRESPKKDVDKPRYVKPTPTYKGELKRVDTQLAGVQKLTERNPKSWIVVARLASVHLERARLTGDYAEYTKARELLQRATEMSTGIGPAMEWAQLEFSLHRQAEAEAWLKKIESKKVVQPKDRVAVAGLRAAMDLEAGRYESALRGLEAVKAKAPGPQAKARLALYHWRTGNFDDAEALYVEAAKGYHGFAAHQHAWYPLQLGLLDLDRGRYDDALAHYQDAAKKLKGYWLIDEHMAEIYALKGENDKARAMYQRLIKETGSPEFMDALSGVEAALGNDAEAKRQHAAARAVYEERLKVFPEAAMGHALDHFIESEGEGDKARALELAKQNVALRPGGPAKTKLAQALLNAGQLDEARAVVDEVAKTVFVSADFFAVAGEVYAKTDPSRAKAMKDKAVAINPNI